MGEQEAARISVSRDALRADLAEMELRLRVYFDDQLRHKQDSAPFIELALKVDALDRGDFSEVHRRALTEFIESTQRVRQDRGWTARERIIGVVAIIVAVVSLGLSLYVGLAAAGRAATDPTPVTTTEGQP